MSKDNTCPSCKGKGYFQSSTDLRGYVACPNCHGSGQQEDKPLTRTEYYEANPPKPEDQLKGIATDSKPEKQNNDTANSNLGAETGIKPEKLTMDEIRDTADKMYGQLAEELSKTSVVIEPSKPDHLREILSNLPEIEQKPYYDAIQALLATEHDRGVKDSYKSIQADFDQGLKDEYDRGKVEGGIEVLEKLKNHLVNGNRLAVGQTLGQVNFVVASEIGAEIMRLERLKSKGEVKSE